MSALVQPIHTGTLNGKPLRFFKAPLPGPHLLWHAPDDLHACLRLPDDLRADFRRKLVGEYADDVRTVATGDGIVTIGPHWMAQGLIGAMIEVGIAKTDLEIAYAQEATAAWNVLTGDLPPEVAVHMMIAAYRNTNGITGGAL